MRRSSRGEHSIAQETGAALTSALTTVLASQHSSRRTGVTFSNPVAFILHRVAKTALMDAATMPARVERYDPCGPIGFWSLDLACDSFKCSRGFRELVRASSVPDTKAGLVRMFAADEAKRLEERISECVETGSDLHIVVSIRGDGQRARKLELRAELECACDGTALGFAGVAFGITEGHLAQDELRRNTLLLQALLATSSGLIFAKDRQGRMLIANPPTLKLIGRS